MKLGIPACAGRARKGAGDLFHLFHLCQRCNCLPVLRNLVAQVVAQETSGASLGASPVPAWGVPERSRALLMDGSRIEPNASPGASSGLRFLAVQPSEDAPHPPSLSVNLAPGLDLEGSGEHVLDAE